MVHPGMVGITELMTDDNFVNWMETQSDDLLDSMNTYQIYELYTSQH